MQQVTDLVTTRTDCARGLATVARSRAAQQRNERMELMLTSPTSSAEDQKQRIKIDQDKQWLVGQYPHHNGNDSGGPDHRPTTLSNGHARMADLPEVKDSRHRPIAVYQNQKVKFTGSAALSPLSAYPAKQFNSLRSPVEKTLKLKKRTS